MMLPTGPPWLHLAEGGRKPNWFRNRARHRPFSGGDSISHPITPLGTVATEVIDPHNLGARYILSCNHVLAALNRAAIGDTVLQPAFADGGRASFDACGFVDRYVPIRFWPQGGNRVDAAVARVNPRDVIPFVDWVGVPAGTRAGKSMSPGERVFKTGRTTLLNSGQVVAVNVSGWIYYPAFFGGFSAAFFEEQIITSGMAGFGDSGSLLFDEDRNAVGLLFGGSPTHTFFNDIVEVERELRVKIAVN